MSYHNHQELACPACEEQETENARLREALSFIEERLSTEQRDDPMKWPSRCDSAMFAARNALKETND